MRFKSIVLAVFSVMCSGTVNSKASDNYGCSSDQSTFSVSLSRLMDDIWKHRQSKYFDSELRWVRNKCASFCSYYDENKLGPSAASSDIKVEKVLDELHKEASKDSISTVGMATGLSFDSSLMLFREYVELDKLYKSSKPADRPLLIKEVEMWNALRSHLVNFSVASAQLQYYGGTMSFFMGPCAELGVNKNRVNQLRAINSLNYSYKGVSPAVGNFTLVAACEEAVKKYSDYYTEFRKDDVLDDRFLKGYYELLVTLKNELKALKETMPSWIEAHGQWCERVSTDGTCSWYLNTAGALLTAIAADISDE